MKTTGDSTAGRLSWTTAEVRAATGGRLVAGAGEAAYPSVGIDSRRVAAGQLFVALRGENHDGHRFAADAVAAGAAGVLAETARLEALPLERWRREGIDCVAVADTTRALGDLGAFNRRRARLTVVAVTGSNGKTSTRRMTAAVVRRRFETLATAGNFNNQIGVPLTLLRLRTAHRRAVLELGMNHPGEIRRLAAICRPDVGVVTNVAPAHLAGFEDIAGVARAKAELVQSIGPRGTVVLNADDDRVADMARLTPARVLRFGRARQADVCAEGVTVTGDGLRFRLRVPGGEADVRLHTPARFMVDNALAAAAVGHLMGLSPPEIRDGLAAFRTRPGRMHLDELAGGIRLIDDTYNANPASMRGALRTLAEVAGAGRRVAVLGDMFELGTRAAELHAGVGRLAGGAGLARLCLAGEFAPVVAGAAVEAGLAPDRVFIGRRREIVSALDGWLRTGDWLLVKGSRGMAMEKVVTGLRAGREDR